MMVDGELDENKILFCRIIVLKLGFSYQIVNEMVSAIIDFINSDEYLDVAMKQLPNMLI